MSKFDVPKGPMVAYVFTMDPLKPQPRLTFSPSETWDRIKAVNKEPCKGPGLKLVTHAATLEWSPNR